MQLEPTSAEAQTLESAEWHLSAVMQRACIQIIHFLAAASWSTWPALAVQAGYHSEALPPSQIGHGKGSTVCAGMQACLLHSGVLSSFSGG